MIRESQIQFYYSKSIIDLPPQKRNTPTGYINISTPDVTAFDLIKYMRQSGHINHVATILSELEENIKAQNLKNTAMYYPPSYSQRLGYMFDELGYPDKTHTLNRFIRKISHRYISLRSDGPKGSFPKSEKWYVIINEELEPDI